MPVECVDLAVRDRPTYLRPSCYYEGYFFRLAIPADALQSFVDAMGGTPEALLIGEVVDATGVVLTNGSWSEIVLTKPDQLKIARAWRPVEAPTAVPTPPRGAKP